jgi:bifunctional non-homologous end joining protein LigD
VGNAIILESAPGSDAAAGSEDRGQGQGLGSIRLAEEREGGLHPVGGVGTGFNVSSAREMKRQLDRLIVSKPPISGLKGKGVVWTKPKIRVEVQFRGRTSDGHLRHPSFKGMCED